jgi:thiosulfate/3-mercaptopyruvate sulfurtransferase
MSNYAHPEVLVDTAWVAAHANDASVRTVEVDVDTAAYDQGHVPGAIAWAWNTQLCDTVKRDVLARAAFEALMNESGITRTTTVVLYGDHDNWFAAWAFWELKLYGHPDVRIMNGGRKKWLAERRELDRTAGPARKTSGYAATGPNPALRALLPEVQAAAGASAAALVDVRSPPEFSGEVVAPPGMSETAQRGGHIPGARNVPWSRIVNEDGTFKSFDEIQRIYASEGIAGDEPIIAYCRIGERASHTWFALKYLLGYANVKNYDGSWTEWGNLVGAPVERGAAPPPR